MLNPIAAKYQVKFDVFPKNSGDLNIVCSAIYSEYKVYTTLLEGLLMPQMVIKRQLENILSYLDNVTYDGIIKGLGVMNVALEEILPKPFDKKMKIDSNVAVVGELLGLTCTDFMSSLPSELYNIFRDIKIGINRMSQILMPGNIMGNIAASLLQLKDDALKEMFGEVYTTILLPLIMYDHFLQENGIHDIIGRMVRIERCMTKPGICNRNKDDFMHSSGVMYSTYYKRAFMISSKGTLNIKSFGGTNKQKAQISNVIKSMNTFRLSIK